MFVWAHRGASVRAPENTLAAFRAAEAAGADGIELDVHLCAEGVPVVIHDETLERTTDGRGPVAALPLAKLKRLDAGGWFAPQFAGEPLPTLEEVVAWAGERLRLNVELKSAPAALAVLNLLRRYPRARVLVSSFDHRLLARLRQHAPQLPLGFLLDFPFWRGALLRAVACRAESLHPRHDLISRPLLAACRRHGLAVHAWTVDEPRRLCELQRLGVDGVFSNDPATARRTLSQPYHSEKHPAGL